MEQPLEVELPRHPSCAAIARRHVGRYAGPQLTGPSLGDAKLVVSELAANAYLHGEGRITLRLDRVDGSLRIEMIDEGEGAAIEVMRAPSSVGGNGLKVVEELSSSWGAYEGTTHVWADVPLGAHAAAEPR